MDKQESPPIDLDWMKWPLLWLVLAIVFAIVIGHLNVPLYERLVAHGEQTQGIATKLTPEFHCTVCYEYNVGGVKFEGQRGSWLPNPPIGEIKVGDPLVVYYDPLNPSLSVLGDPKPMLKSELTAVGMVTLVAPTVIVLVLLSKQQKTT